MTPHIEANKGEIAKKVLMPGDPLRAEFIAKEFLSEVHQVNRVRNMLMFTGLYQGKPVSICGSGMGQPSIGIYSFELFKFYDVDSIIRVGSAGSYQSDLNLYDIVLAQSTYTDSTAFSQLVLGDPSHVAYPSMELNSKIEERAKNLSIPISKGQVHSSDVFYSNISLEQRIKTTQAICVEMECAALFVNAKATDKQASCLLTISDNLITKEETSAAQRQTAFTRMIRLALDV